MNSTTKSRAVIAPQRLFWLFFLIILLSICLLSFPKGDGLRHVGIAFSGEFSWKDVYPFSYFSEYASYSPWYGYDLILNKIFAILQYIPIQSSTLKFIFIKIFSFFLVTSIFCLIIYKSELIKEIISFQTFLLSSGIVLILLTPFFLRSIIIRPFVFGTIFLILSFGASGYLMGLFYAFFLIFLYPYLSWFYILPVAFCHFFLGNRNFAYALLMAIVFFFMLQESSFWRLQTGVFLSASIREQMGINISELSQAYRSFYCMFILTSIVIFYPFFHSNKYEIKYGDLLLASYLLPAIMYIRTFFDILSPLLFIVYSKSIMAGLSSIIPKILDSWKIFVFEVKILLSEKTPIFIQEFLKKISRASSSKISLKPFILLLYGILFLFVIKINMDQLKSVNNNEKLFSPIPKNSIVLSSFNQQYNILFVRPDLKIIPSSEIGMPSPIIRNEYINFFKMGIFRNLASNTSASYLIEAKDIYLNPSNSRYLELVGKNNELSIWKIVY